MKIAALLLSLLTCACGKGTCFDKPGTSYRCVCTRPGTGGSTGQYSDFICALSDSEAANTSKSSCGSTCTGCTCARRDDTSACTYEQGKGCR